MLVKKGLMNFFRLLKLYIPALGILSLGLIIGLALFFNIARNSINDLIKVVETTVSDSKSLNFDSFKNSILDSLKTLPWNNFFEAIGKLFNKNFLVDAFSSAIKNMIGEELYLSSGLSQNVGNTATQFTTGFLSFAFCFLTSSLVSMFYTKTMCKKELQMKIPFKKFIIVKVFGIILNFILVGLLTYLLGFFPFLAFLTAIFIILINQAISLVEAYFCRENKKLKFKNVFSFKIILQLVAVILIVSLIISLISFILILVTNQVAAYILTLPLIFVFYAVVAYNAYSYVKDYYSDKKKECKKN